MQCRSWPTLKQRQKITSDPRGVGAQFGNAVAIDGNTMVVGARFDSTTASQAGAAFVYVLNGTIWTQQAKLLANDGAAFDKFGESVAINGDTIVVGAYQDDAPLSNGGSAYVFVRNGTTWMQQQKLAASDGTADDEFGVAVAVNGSTVFVGAHFADLPTNSAAGAVYRFTRSGTVWSEVQKLIPVGGVILGDHFGESLATSGSLLAVGAPGTDVPETAAGSVYVFAESGAAYVMQDKISIASGTNGDNFGGAVALEGTTLVGGAREDTSIPAEPAYGAAYVFEFDGSWMLQQKLTASDGAMFDRFGWSVAVSDDSIAVGAREDDTVVGAEAGSAYLFTRSGTTWTEDQKLEPNDSFNGDRFGASVALSSGQVVVGASEKNLTNPNGQGAVYTFAMPRVFPDFDGDRKADLSVFRPSDSTWRFTRSSDGAVSSISCCFGIGNVRDLIVPADYDGDNKTDVAVFRPSSGTWSGFNSSTSLFFSVNFGATGDLPVPGDFDGDGLADLSVFRPATGEWLRINSSNDQPVTVMLGTNGDLPLVADFDGDGKSDISYYRPSNGNWGILRSSDNSFSSVPFGGDPGDIPAPADYDGDGKTDIAVFKPDTVQWIILNSGTGTVTTRQIFTSSCPGIITPTSADFDGDGRAEPAAFQSSSGLWAILQEDGSLSVTAFGTPEDRPVPLFFVRQGTFASNLHFSACTASATETPNATTRLDLTVARTGDTSGAASVNYTSSDGTANERSDYLAALGTLHFQAFETAKTISIFIVDDSLGEAAETFTVTLSNPSGSSLTAQSKITVTINTNESVDGPNPVRDASFSSDFFVRQHYVDFFNREADAEGLAFWKNQIDECTTQACREIRRINVSAAFFVSIEFQQTGYLVYKANQAAFNSGEQLNLQSFLPDTQEIGRGVIIGQPGADQLLETKKQSFFLDFVQQPAFLAPTAYPTTLTAAQFVDKLNANTFDPRTPGAGALSPGERQALIDQLAVDPTSPSLRAQVLRSVSENGLFTQRQFNKAFVLMQYFGYLRRNPNATPDSNFDGYNFWLGKLNQFNGNFVDAEMVKAFITSSEYIQRFGQ